MTLDEANAVRIMTPSVEEQDRILKEKAKAQAESLTQNIKNKIDASDRLNQVNYRSATISNDLNKARLDKQRTEAEIARDRSVFKRLANGMSMSPEEYQQTLREQGAAERDLEYLNNPLQDEALKINAQKNAEHYNVTSMDIAEKRRQLEIGKRDLSYELNSMLKAQHYAQTSHTTQTSPYELVLENTKGLQAHGMLDHLEQGATNLFGSLLSLSGTIEAGVEASAKALFTDQTLGSAFNEAMQPNNNSLMKAAAQVKDYSENLGVSYSVGMGGTENKQLLKEFREQNNIGLVGTKTFSDLANITGEVLAGSAPEIAATTALFAGTGGISGLATAGRVAAMGNNLNRATKAASAIGRSERVGLRAAEQAAKKEVTAAEAQLAKASRVEAKVGSAANVKTAADLKAWSKANPNAALPDRLAAYKQFKAANNNKYAPKVAAVKDAKGRAAAKVESAKANVGSIHELRKQAIDKQKALKAAIANPNKKDALAIVKSAGVYGKDLKTYANARELGHLSRAAAIARLSLFPLAGTAKASYESIDAHKGNVNTENFTTKVLEGMGYWALNAVEAGMLLQTAKAFLPKGKILEKALSDSTKLGKGTTLDKIADILSPFYATRSRLLNAGKAATVGGIATYFGAHIEGVVETLQTAFELDMQNPNYFNDVGGLGNAIKSALLAQWNDTDYRLDHEKVAKLREAGDLGFMGALAIGGSATSIKTAYNLVKGTGENTSNQNTNQPSNNGGERSDYNTATNIADMRNIYSSEVDKITRTPNVSTEQRDELLNNARAEYSRALTERTSKNIDRYRNDPKNIDKLKKARETLADRVTNAKSEEDKQKAEREFYSNTLPKIVDEALGDTVDDLFAERVHTSGKTPEEVLADIQTAYRQTAITGDLSYLHTMFGGTRTNPIADGAITTYNSPTESNRRGRVQGEQRNPDIIANEFINTLSDLDILEALFTDPTKKAMLKEIKDQFEKVIQGITENTNLTGKDRKEAVIHALLEVLGKNKDKNGDYLYSDLDQVFMHTFLTGSVDTETGSKYPSVSEFLRSYISSVLSRDKDGNPIYNVNAENNTRGRELVSATLSKERTRQAWEAIREAWVGTNPNERKGYIVYNKATKKAEFRSSEPQGKENTIYFKVPEGQDTNVESNLDRILYKISVEQAALDKLQSLYIKEGLLNENEKSLSSMDSFNDLKTEVSNALTTLLPKGLIKNIGVYFFNIMSSIRSIGKDRIDQVLLLSNLVDVRNNPNYANLEGVLTQLLGNDVKFSTTFKPSNKPILLLPISTFFQGEKLSNAEIERMYSEILTNIRNASKPIVFALPADFNLDSDVAFTNFLNSLANIDDVTLVNADANLSETITAFDSTKRIKTNVTSNALETAIEDEVSRNTDANGQVGLQQPVSKSERSVTSPTGRDITPSTVVQTTGEAVDKAKEFFNVSMISDIYTAIKNTFKRVHRQVSLMTSNSNDIPVFKVLEILRSIHGKNAVNRFNFTENLDKLNRALALFLTNTYQGERDGAKYDVTTELNLIQVNGEVVTFNPIVLFKNNNKASLAMLVVAMETMSSLTEIKASDLKRLQEAKQGETRQELEKKLKSQLSSTVSAKIGENFLRLLGYDVDITFNEANVNISTDLLHQEIGKSIINIVNQMSVAENSKPIFQETENNDAKYISIDTSAVQKFITTASINDKTSNTSLLNEISETLQIPVDKFKYRDRWLVDESYKEFKLAYAENSFDNNGELKGQGKKAFYRAWWDSIKYAFTRGRGTKELSSGFIDNLKKAASTTINFITDDVQVVDTLLLDTLDTDKGRIAAYRANGWLSNDEINALPTNEQYYAKQNNLNIENTFSETIRLYKQWKESGSKDTKQLKDLLLSNFIGGNNRVYSNNANNDKINTMINPQADKIFRYLLVPTKFKKSMDSNQLRDELKNFNLGWMHSENPLSNDGAIVVNSMDINNPYFIRFLNSFSNGKIREAINNAKANGDIELTITDTLGKTHTLIVSNNSSKSKLGELLSFSLWADDILSKVEALRQGQSVNLLPTPNALEIDGKTNGIFLKMLLTLNSFNDIEFLAKAGLFLTEGNGKIIGDSSIELDIYENYAKELESFISNHIKSSSNPLLKLMHNMLTDTNLSKKDKRDLVKKIVQLIAYGSGMDNMLIQSVFDKFLPYNKLVEALNNPNIPSNEAIINFAHYLLTGKQDNNTKLENKVDEIRKGIAHNYLKNNSTVLSNLTNAINGKYASKSNLTLKAGLENLNKSMFYGLYRFNEMTKKVSEHKEKLFTSLLKSRIKELGKNITEIDVRTIIDDVSRAVGISFNYDIEFNSNDYSFHIYPKGDNTEHLGSVQQQGIDSTFTSASTVGVPSGFGTGANVLVIHGLDSVLMQASLDSVSSQIFDAMVVLYGNVDTAGKDYNKAIHDMLIKSPNIIYNVFLNEAKNILFSYYSQLLNSKTEDETKAIKANIGDIQQVFEFSQDKRTAILSKAIIANSNLMLMQMGYENSTFKDGSEVDINTLAGAYEVSGKDLLTKDKANALLKELMYTDAERHTLIYGTAKNKAKVQQRQRERFNTLLTRLKNSQDLMEQAIYQTVVKELDTADTKTSNALFNNIIHSLVPSISTNKYVRKLGELFKDSQLAKSLDSDNFFIDVLQTIGFDKASLIALGIILKNTKEEIPGNSKEEVKFNLIARVKEEADILRSNLREPIKISRVLDNVDNPLFVEIYVEQAINHLILKNRVLKYIGHQDRSIVFNEIIANAELKITSDKDTIRLLEELSEVLGNTNYELNSKAITELADLLSSNKTDNQVAIASVTDERSPTNILTLDISKVLDTIAQLLPNKVLDPAARLKGVTGKKSKTSLIVDTTRQLISRLNQRFGKEHFHIVNLNKGYKYSAFRNAIKTSLLNSLKSTGNLNDANRNNIISIFDNSDIYDISELIRLYKDSLEKLNKNNPEPIEANIFIYADDLLADNTYFKDGVLDISKLEEDQRLLNNMIDNLLNEISDDLSTHSGTINLTIYLEGKVGKEIDGRPDIRARYGMNAAIYNVLNNSTLEGIQLSSDLALYTTHHNKVAISEETSKGSEVEVTENSLEETEEDLYEDTNDRDMIYRGDNYTLATPSTSQYNINTRDEDKLSSSDVARATTILRKGGRTNLPDKLVNSNQDIIKTIPEHIINLINDILIPVIKAAKNGNLDQVLQQKKIKQVLDSYFDKLDITKIESIKDFIETLPNTGNLNETELEQSANLLQKFLMQDFGNNILVTDNKISNEFSIAMKAIINHLKQDTQYTHNTTYNSVRNGETVDTGHTLEEYQGEEAITQLLDELIEQDKREGLLSDLDAKLYRETLRFMVKIGALSLDKLKVLKNSYAGKGEIGGTYTENTETVSLNNYEQADRGTSRSSILIHELTHAATVFALNNDGNLLSKGLNTVFHKLMKSPLFTPQELANYFNGDLELATDYYNHFVSYFRNPNPNSLKVGMAEFVAIAASDVRFRSFLEKIEISEETSPIGKSSVINKVWSLLQQSWNKIYSMVTNDVNSSKKQTGLTVVDAYINRVIKAQGRAKAAPSRLQIIGRVSADFAKKANAKLSSKVKNYLVSNYHQNEALRDIVYMAEDIAKLASGGALSKAQLATIPFKYYKLIMRTSMDEELAQGILTILGRSIGTTSSLYTIANALLSSNEGKQYYALQQYINISDNIDKVRNEEKVLYTEAVKDILQGKTEQERVLLSKALLNTDIYNSMDLLATHFNIKYKADLALLFNRDYLIDNHINNMTTTIRDSLNDTSSQLYRHLASFQRNIKFDEYARYLDKATDNLAAFMITGKAIAPGLKMNAEQIARMFGEDTNYSGKIPQQLIERIDALTTMKAIKLLSKEQGREISSLLNSISTSQFDDVVNIAKNANKIAMEKSFNGNKIMAIKGYSPNSYDNSIKFIIVPESAERTYVSKGYTRRAVMSRPNEGTFLLMTTKADYQVNTLNRTAMRYSNQFAKGFGLEDSLRARVANGEDFRIVAAQVQDKKKHQAKMMHDTFASMYKGTFNERAEDYMVPIYNNQGQVVDYRFTVSQYVQENVLGINNDIAEKLGTFYAQNYDKVHTLKHNRQVVDFMYQDYIDSSMDNISEDRTERARLESHKFIPFRSKEDEKDPNSKIASAMYRQLPDDTKEYLAEKFGGTENAVINVKFLTMLLGFQEESLLDSPTIQTLMRNKNVDNDLLRTISQRGAEISGALTKLEGLLKQFTTNVKQDIVIKNPAVIIGNIAGAITTNFSYGQSIPSMLNYIKEGIEANKRYEADRNAILNLKIQLSAKPNGRDAALEREIRKYQNSLTLNPIYQLRAEEGMLNTISEDLKFDDDNKSTLEEIVEGIEKRVQSLPGSKGLLEVIRTMYITDKVNGEKNLMKEFLVQAAYKTDFLFKYALIRHLESNEGMSHTMAVNTANNAHINYALPIGPMFANLDRTGLLLFSKYILGITRAGKRLLLDRPLTFGLSTLIGNVGNFQTISDMWLPTHPVMGFATNPYEGLTTLLEPDMLHYMGHK